MNDARPSTTVGFTRRHFLHAAGAAAITAAAYRRVLGANERVGVGFIGYGLIGKRHLLDFQEQPDVNCVAVSDAHRGRVDEAKGLMGGDARGFADFRKLLEDRAVDAVVVSTPDHWHALMTMMACAAGKDVYVEKPLSLFIREGRWMIDVAQRTGRIVQVGTQQRSGPHYQRARELIRNGHIGAITSVRMQAHRNIVPGFGSPADCPPPPELDWESFLGPAPSRPYNPNRGIYHFRWFWDYSGGQMTNLGHHSLDILHWVLGVDPKAVTSIGGRFVLEDNGETPDTQDAMFEFGKVSREQSDGSPNEAATKGFTAIWSHREASAGGKVANMEFFGTKGSLAINRTGFVIAPDKKVPPQNRIPSFAGAHPVGGPQPVALSGPDEFWTEVLEDKGNDRDQFTRHVRNFLDCVKSRAVPISNLESGHRVSTMSHLANLSLRLDLKLRWDSQREEIIDDPAANEHLVRPYRAPWDRELRALLT